MTSSRRRVPSPLTCGNDEGRSGPRCRRPSPRPTGADRAYASKASQDRALSPARRTRRGHRVPIPNQSTAGSPTRRCFCTDSSTRRQEVEPMMLNSAARSAANPGWLSFRSLVKIADTSLICGNVWAACGNRTHDLRITRCRRHAQLGRTGFQITLSGSIAVHSRRFAWLPFWLPVAVGGGRLSVDAPHLFGAPGVTAS